MDIRSVLLLTTLAFVAPSLARAEQSSAPAPAPEPERPEYRARSLPTDVFHPSEQVEEDTPVAFPEDI